MPHGKTLGLLELSDVAQFRRWFTKFTPLGLKDTVTPAWQKEEPCLQSVA